MTDCLLFDVDGTLVDTNYLHTVAWHRAFLRFDLVVPNWRIHRAIGMGGDQLVPALVGDKAEADLGDQIREAWADEYQIEYARPFEGAHRLLSEAASVGIVVVLASSGPPDHVEHYIDLLDARDIAAAWTTSEEVSTTKPAPELLQVALDKVSVDRASAVGDSVWDCDAAKRLRLPAVGTLTGGTSRDELMDHGAIAVYEQLDQLRADLKDLAFVRLDAGL